MLYEKTAQVACPAVAQLPPALRGQAVPREPWYPSAKVTLEWMAALVLLVLTAPVMAVLAALVKLTSEGPVFYKQVRLGLNGVPFPMYKLRSMTQNCEAKTGAVWSVGDDPRVTRIGRFMRDTHLDELPQLWNVLCGQMSIIGPRPERPELVARLERSIPRYRERLAVRPGLTGLAQVQFPADADLSDVRRKLAHDLYYVRRLNFWMDVRIAACTLFHLSGLTLNSVGKLFVRSCAQEITYEDEETSPQFGDLQRAVKTA